MGVFFITFLRSLKGPTRNLLLRVSLFFLYLLVGAAIFQALESQAEHQEKHHFEKVKLNLKIKYNISEKDIGALVKEVQKAIEEGYFDANYYDRWNFAGSLFFTATVVTTIGYGELAPVTFWGRLFCVFYALFGIPITGLMLKSVGEKISIGISIVIRWIEPKIFHREPRLVPLKTAVLIFLMMILMVLILGGLSVQYEGWTFFEGIYFSFITLSTIGFGDFVPMHPSEYRAMSATHVILFTAVTFVYITVGLSVVSSAMLAISRALEEPNPWDFVSLVNQEEEEDDETPPIISKDQLSGKAYSSQSSYKNSFAKEPNH